MSTNYSATLVVGVQIPGPDHLRRKSRVKAFDHDFPPEWVACPTTGRNLWKDVYLPLPGVEDRYEMLSEGGAHMDEDVTVGGMKCLTLGTEFKRHYFIAAGGFSVSDRRWDPVRIEGLDLASLKDACRAALEPLGFWDEAKFGAYLVMSAS